MTRDDPRPKSELIDSPERFTIGESGQFVTRLIRLRSGKNSRTRISVDRSLSVDSTQDRLSAAADQIMLRSNDPPLLQSNGRTIRVVDLFSGAGLLTLGAMQACHALNLRFRPVMAVDTNPEAVAAYKLNFPDADARQIDIDLLLDGKLGMPASSRESDFRSYVGSVDVLLGGPPCQGHSDLNNHTRRDDPKNRLYERMARFADIVRPKHIIIENVPAVRHDRNSVVEKVSKHLDILGYRVASGVVRLGELGVPQSRSRHVLVASLSTLVDIESIKAAYQRPPRGVTWAIGDLRRVRGHDIFDTPSTATTRNERRIEYLFGKQLYDLPDSQRPDCHRYKSHSYKSVYGRLRPDQPAQTITSGYGSMGQGRYVHPSKKRTITPHEAARLQMIPDYFDLRQVSKRTALAEIIGNAVPPKLSHVFALELLR